MNKQEIEKKFNEIGITVKWFNNEDTAGDLTPIAEVKVFEYHSISIYKNGLCSYNKKLTYYKKYRQAIEIAKQYKEME